MANHSTPIYTLVARICWMVAGPALLLLISYIIVMVSDGWLVAADLLFFVVLAGMIFARWVELNSGRAVDAFGEAVTIQHVRRYTLAAIVGGLALWLAANMLGNHLL